MFEMSSPPDSTAPTADDIRIWSPHQLMEYLEPLIPPDIYGEVRERMDEAQIDSASFIDYGCPTNMDYASISPDISSHW